MIRKSKTTTTTHPNDSTQKIADLIGHKSHIRTTVNEIIFYISTEINDISHYSGFFFLRCSSPLSLPIAHWALCVVNGVYQLKLNCWMDGGVENARDLVVNLWKNKFQFKFEKFWPNSVTFHKWNMI